MYSGAKVEDDSRRLITYWPTGMCCNARIRNWNLRRHISFITNYRRHYTNFKTSIVIIPRELSGKLKTFVLISLRENLHILSSHWKLELTT